LWDEGRIRILLAVIYVKELLLGEHS